MSNAVNEIVRKGHAKRLGLPENTSWAEINRYLDRQQASNTAGHNVGAKSTAYAKTVVQTTKAAWSENFSPVGA